MTGDQLDFDGGATPYPLRRPHRLTERQRELVRYMRAHQSLLDVAGMETRHARMFFADASGALRRLESIGLVRHEKRGHWTVT